MPVLQSLRTQCERQERYHRRECVLGRGARVQGYWPHRLDEKWRHRHCRNRVFLPADEVERSPICRLDSDCWDVKLTFFPPGKVFEQARKVYRFTVDVSDVCPVMIGKVRSWFVR